MKKSFLLLLIFYASIYAHSQQSKYSKSIEAKIQQVENSLAGWYQASPDTTKLWNLQDRMHYFGVQGVSIAVIHNYQLQWARGYGWADEKEKKSVDNTTLFQAASISKSLNAVALLRLVQEGKVDIDNDIRMYLKTWSLPSDSFGSNAPVTLKGLLSHTAGISTRAFAGYRRGDSLPTLIQMLEGRSPANSEKIHSVRAAAKLADYSGGGILISRQVVEDVTGMPYDKYLYKKVLRPLGMTRSFFTQPPFASRERELATGYSYEGTEVPGKYHIYPEMAPDGLWTNPTELSKFIINTQRSYSGKTGLLLSPAITRLQLTPCMSNFGLGVFIDQKGKSRYFEHSGANEGFVCEYFGSMEGGDGMVIMINSDNGRKLLEEIEASIAQVYGWEGFYKPAIKKLVTVPKGILENYAGVYDMNGLPLSVVWRGDGLALRVPRGLYYPLLFTDEADFFVYEVNLSGSFQKNKDGKFETLILHTAGGEQKAIKK